MDWVGYFVSFVLGVVLCQAFYTWLIDKYDRARADLRDTIANQRDVITALEKDNRALRAGRAYWKEES